MEELAFPSEKQTERGLAQSQCLFEHCVEHRGEVAGEELMTCSTSTVAVCCSRASASSASRSTS
jgi:hypothetical protein